MLVSSRKFHFVCLTPLALSSAEQSTTVRAVTARNAHAHLNGQGCSNKALHAALAKSTTGSPFKHLKAQGPNGPPQLLLAFVRMCEVRPVLSFAWPSEQLPIGRARLDHRRPCTVRHFATAPPT